jgi:hypothetical protein
MVLRILVYSLAIFFYPFDLAMGQANAVALQAHGIRTVPRDSLSDLAVAYADPADPVVYYNPHLMAQYGPEMSAFVLAHEFAHIELGHRRPALPYAGSPEAFERLLRGWELEADCRAATRLAAERPSALQAAIGFFERMGSGRVDREHPIGTVRAEQLAACGRRANGDPRAVGEGPRTSATANQFK